MGSDLFWTKTLVYTELLTPGWYSSGGKALGIGRARWYFTEGLRHLSWPSHHCGAGGHIASVACPLVTVQAPRPLPVTHIPATATAPHPSGGTSPPQGSTLHGCTKTQPQP